MYVLWARRGARGGARTLVLRAGVCVCVWALGALPPPSVVAPLRGASEAGRSPSSGCPPPGGCRGPLSTCCGQGCAGVVPVACMPCEGRLVPGAVPPPLGRAARVPRPVCPGRGRCGCGEPAPAPQRAPLRAGVARCGGGGRASPGGGAFYRCEGHLRPGAPPLPAARPPGGLPGSVTHVLWARVCGCVGAALSPWLACPVGAACRGGGGGPPTGGVACHRCEGRLVSGAVPPPAAHPLERVAGGPRPVCPGCGRCARGDPAPVPQRAPLLSVGMAEGRNPERAPFVVARGV